MTKRPDLSLIFSLLCKKDLPEKQIRRIHDALFPVARDFLSRRFQNIQEMDRDAVANEAVYRLFETRGTIRDIAKAETFFYRICRNLANDFLRKERRFSRRYPLPAVVPESCVDKHPVNGYPQDPPTDKHIIDGVEGIADSSSVIAERTTARLQHPEDLILKQVIEESIDEMRRKHGERYVYVIRAKAEKVSSKEIAKDLGITANNVDVIYLRARRMLAELIRRRGGP